MKKIFVTFGSGIYEHSVKRLLNEAKSINIFDIVFGFNESILGEDITSLRLFQTETRGFGYWLWKPYVVLKVLETMNENDILLYADSGCRLNHLYRQRIIEYFNMLDRTNSSNIAFRLRYPERNWTKKDLFDYFNVDVESLIASTGQLMATSFLIKKTPGTIKLVEKWYETGKLLNHHYIDDSPSISKNWYQFSEHRHDQSIFSILRKMNTGTIILNDEVDECQDIFPIHAFRIKYRGYILFGIPRKELVEHMLKVSNRLVLVTKWSDYKRTLQFVELHKLEIMYCNNIEQTVQKLQNDGLMLLNSN